MTNTTRSVAQAALASLLAVSALGCTPSTSVRSEADRHSQQVGLEPIRSGSQSELRVWHYDYMTGFVWGYLVHDDEIVVFEFETNPEAPVAPSSRQIPTPEGISILGRARELRRYDAQTWSCPVYDGGKVIVDALIDRRRFTLSAGNPEFCDDARSRAVAELHSSITAIEGVVEPFEEEAP
jgi:hypothetical protein